MQRVAQSSYPTEDLETDLHAAHEQSDASLVDPSDLKPAIAFALGTAVDAVTIHDAMPTDNAARPKSILTIECSVEDDSYVAEILCTEETTIEDEDAIDQHGDGTMSIPVSAFGAPKKAYEAVDVIIYDAD